MIFKIFIESIVQAFQQIWGNKLRSFLTLLGIIIGGAFLSMWMSNTATTAMMLTLVLQQVHSQQQLILLHPLL